MTRKTITLKLVLGLHPCLTREHILELSQGRKRMSITDVLHIEQARPEHKLWLVLREAFLTKCQLRLLACDFAERALDRLDSPDPRSVEAVAVARRYALGEATGDELKSAHRAAAAGADAVYAAAADAAAAAAGAGAGAGAAAGAAYAGERQWQVERVLEVLEQ